MLVSIDPGLKKVAVAVWGKDFKLVTAALVQVDHPPGTERAQKWLEMAAPVVSFLQGLAMFPVPFDFLIEVPQVYSDIHSRKDPNDLIDLAGVLGAIVGMCPNSTVVWSPQPREWKGQLPKHVTQTRVDSKLSDEEKARIEWPSKSLAHNVYDAIHLGIVHLERDGLREFVK